MAVRVPNINFKGQGTLFDGFSISYGGGRVFEYFTDQYSAKLVSDREILVTMPSTGPGYLYKYNQVYENQRLSNDLILEEQQAHNLLQNAVAADEDRQKVWLLLRFPLGVHLTPVPFANENETTLPCDLEHILRMDIIFGTEYSRTTDIIHWHVGIRETEVRRANEVPPVTTEGPAAARL
jgi:hypothetical protein